MAGHFGTLGWRAVHRVLTVLIPLAVVCAYAAQLVQPVTHTAVTPTSEIVSAPSTIGIADSSLYGMSQQDIDTTLDMLQAMGVEDVRVYIPWVYTEPLRGQYNWAPIDAIMNAAKARNMGVLAMANSTPVWAGTAGSFPGAKTPDPVAYANFMTQVATRYGNTISAYEVWNEVNCVCFYDPVSPASYAQLLQAAYPAIKAVDPTATVIAAGLGSVFTFGGITMNPVDYVNGMYAAGAKGFFDALAFHPYQETLKFTDGAGVPLSPLTQIQNIYDLMVANGDGALKIWITEYGVPTDHVTEQTQAEYIKDLIDAWQSMSFGGPLFIYTTRDGQPGSGYFGIFNADWIPKEAALVIAEEILRLNGIGGIEGIAARVLAVVRLAIGAAVNVIADIGKAVVKVADAAWNAFVDVTKWVTQAVVNTVKVVTQAVVNGVKWVANTAVNVTKAVVAGISNVIQKIGDIIRPPASSAAVPPTAALKAVAAMKEVAAELDSPKATAATKSESAAAQADLKVAQGKGTGVKDAGSQDAVKPPTAEPAKEPTKEPAKEPATEPEVKPADTKNPASGEPEAKTPDAKDAVKPGSEGKKPADQKDSKDPTSEAPKGDKGTKPGQHKGGDDKAANSAASGDSPKGKTPKSSKSPAKSKPKPAKTAAATGETAQSAKADQN
jgi:polysaccharide biosynthesis protein PslG